MSRISYEIQKGIRTDVLKGIVDFFNCSCSGTYNFYCTKTTYPLYNPKYSFAFRLDFDFDFEIDKNFKETFNELLQSVDKEEGINE